MTVDTTAAPIALFDFGGVVIRTPFELDPDPAHPGPWDPAADAWWGESMRGEISERDYWDRRARRHHPAAEDPTFAYMRDLYETDEARIVRPEIVTLLDRLDAAGIRTAVLTNDLRAFHGQQWVDRMSVIRRFDPLIDLSHVGFLKPAPEAFEHALKILDAPAHDVVFLDDQPGNVHGAIACGIRAVWFDPTEVEQSIRRYRAALGRA